MLTTAGPSSPGGRAPAHAPGLTFLGTPSSAHEDPHGLVRRDDGQVLQLTPLLYAVLCELDGDDARAVAERVEQRTGRVLTADDVTFLVEERLAPLGVLDGEGPDRPATANPLLGLRLRWAVSDPDTTRRITRPFAALFHPVVVAAVLAGFATSLVWLLFHRGLAVAARQALFQPLWLLVLLALTLLSAAFHEFGHAAACRRAGATPGTMGVGLYLLWPAFYTDVTDAYRLDRRGRLLVDLGGLYFNCVFGLVGILGWGVTGVDALLLILPVQVLQMLRQLLPFLRYDGYHVLADLTGVPDLFTQIGPTLSALRPSNWGRPSPSRLRRSARLLVLGWTLVTVPLLVGAFGMLLFSLPTVLSTTAASAELRWQALTGATSAGNAAGVVLAVVQLAVLVIAPLSIGYLAWRLGRRGLRAVWRRTDGRPGHRVAVATILAGLTALLVWALQPDDDWKPLAGAGEPHRAPSGSPTTIVARGGPARSLPLRASAVTPAMPAAPVPPPTEPATPTPEATPTADDADGSEVAAPDPAGDEVAPRPTGPASPEDESRPPETAGPATDPSSDGDAAPGGDPAPTPRDAWIESTSLPTTWSWSFGRPAPARAIDNVAISAVDGDATWMRSFTTELVVAGSDEVIDHRNEAHAYARCTDCGAYAAALQVVLLPQHHDVVVPRNLAGSLNEDCVRCSTVSVADQLVVSVSQVPDDATLARIQDVLDGLAPLRDQLETIAPAELRAAFQDAQRDVLRILAEAEPTGTTPGFRTDTQVADDGTVDHATSTNDEEGATGPASSEPAAPGTTTPEADATTDTPTEESDVSAPDETLTPPDPAPTPSPGDPTPAPTPGDPTPVQPTPQPSEPITEPDPEPVPVPQPDPTPTPLPDPAPTPEPSPDPEPEPSPTPAPDPEPVPTPSPDPTPPAPEEDTTAATTTSVATREDEATTTETAPVPPEEGP